MRRRGVFLLAALLLGAAAPALAQQPVRIVETFTVNAEPGSEGPAATHDLHLTLYAFRGTRWAPAEAVTAVWDAMQIVAPCGIALAEAELRVLETPDRFHVFSTAVSRELLRDMKAPKPAVFFVEDTRNEPAYEAEAIGRANSATRPELTDTIWVAYGSQVLPQALAHELVHLLSDSGDHSTDPGNLMRYDLGPEDLRLTDAQCQRVRARGEANGLLRKHDR
jgi:hypothetical protein